MWCGSYGVFGLCSVRGDRRREVQGNAQWRTQRWSCCGPASKKSYAPKRSDRRSYQQSWPAPCGVPNQKQRGRKKRGPVRSWDRARARSDRCAGGGSFLLLVNAVLLMKTACGIRCWITFARGALGVQGAVPQVPGLGRTGKGLCSRSTRCG